MDRQLCRVMLSVARPTVKRLKRMNKGPIAGVKVRRRMVRGSSTQARVESRRIRSRRCRVVKRKELIKVKASKKMHSRTNNSCKEMVAKSTWML